MSGLVIRPASEGDFEAIAALTNHFILNTTVHFGTRPASADELRRAWRAAPEHPFLVAEAAGEFAGYAKSYRWREREAYARTAEIGIYLMEHARGKGQGRALYAALIDACRAAGFHTLIGGIALPNDVSVRLHESLGFERVGVFREVGWKMDAWRDVGFWQLQLRPPATSG